MKFSRYSARHFVMERVRFAELARFLYVRWQQVRATAPHGISSVLLLPRNYDKRHSKDVPRLYRLRLDSSLEAG